MRILFAFLLVASLAHGDGTVTLRFAAIAPDGTAWARQLRAFTRDVETLTNGTVKMKWYLGGIAGDEMTVLERIKRGQLDGSAGSEFCDRLAPSLRVTRLVGLFKTHNEVLFVLGNLRKQLEDEFVQHGFISLGVGGGFGESIVFSREPIRSLADLRRSKMWVWDLEEVLRLQLPLMKIPMVTLGVNDAAKAYDDRKLDGFIAIPSAALAFQWSSQARYYTELRIGFLPGCMVISTTAFDALTLEQQRALKQAAAPMIARFEDVGREQDGKLLNGLFEKQGLTRIPLTQGFFNDFFEAAKISRDKLGTQLVKTELLQTVTGWLDEYRAAHGSK
jgi:TRAP-type C4-dicarboxylate transport system substrate-binding protein